MKAAALFRAANESIQIELVHSGQHISAFFDELNLPQANAILEIEGMLHGKMTGMMLEQIESILLDRPPDWVMVFGDTNTRAVHVYQRAGCKIVGEFIASWHPVPHYQMELYMKNLNPKKEIGV